MARPQKTATLSESQIEALASIGCSDSEIAVLCELDEATVKRSFAPLLKKGRASLRTKLRKAQVDKALKGDTTMLIWMGKVYLNQTDKQSVDMTHAGAVRTVIFHGSRPVEPDDA